MLYKKNTLVLKTVVRVEVQFILGDPGAESGGNSSMLRHSLRLNCIKSYNDHNFVKIYHNLPNFGNLGKIGNLNFSVT